MNEKNDVLQIIGSLMKEPTILSKTDKYCLTLSDFSTRFEKYLFDAINGLYFNGAKTISVLDIMNYLGTNGAATSIFEKNNGAEYLQDALEFSEVGNFDYYYEHLKKINLLKSCQKMGIDTSNFYCENLTDPRAMEVNQNFEKLTIKDIIEILKRNVLGLEQTFMRNDVSETKNVFSDLSEIIEDAKNGDDIGLPIQGEIINEVMAGARKGTLCIRSGSSGLSKTRQAVGDACYLAFPIRYNQTTCSWELKGSCEKVLFIATEQNFKEIQRMVLAYLTGFNESKFRFGQFTEQEMTVVNQALKVLEKYQDNFQITKMPNPTNELIKSVIRENCILHDVEYVFYDYVFIGPALLNEFRGFNLRNDELLLMLTTTLKDLASELNIFIMTSTQVNANADDNKNIRNESSLAGGRATINKADYGFIMARPTNEELNTLEPFITKYNKIPNIVTDVFKVRAGEWTQVRIWTVFDAGNLRKEDLFLTDSRLEEIDISHSYNFVYEWDTEEYDEINNLVLELNGVK